ncbi:hypothetical protein HU200_018971 [Digitaria exilis]|uniref:NB-ARC domain-containing protein n=1 Tax=Digitaria exilis TaxID=1010633 RepID=A0A835F3J1_9POAL|nr:hypothetical protein HU200_018971 [Digitaria exilis]CAB3460889.1 unnamed protein product [Digitaria exilis]
MEMLSSAVVGEFMNRSISFLLSKLDKETTATMQEDLQRLRHLLLRSGAIIQDAEHRHVPSKAMMQQLKALRDETFRGYYVLDVVRCRAALGGDDRRRRNRNGDEDEAGLRAFALSRFNPAKRVRFPSGGAPPETDESVVLDGGARSPVELQQVVRSLEFMVGDMKEFVMFLGSYSPLYRQPYSAHLVVDKCMFGRQMEKEMVLEFLLKKHEPETLGVLPIVGPAHIGKSTLVEHVCGDERVRNHFSLILFYTGNDLKDVTVSSFKDRCMIKHHTDNNASQERQRLLVVIELLDDVDDETWNELYSSQRSEVAEGSKIIVTSRSEKVARFGTTQTSLRMKSLPIEAYWYLLKTAAFGSDDPEQHPKMASLALEMADTVRGSFMFVYIGASLLRDNFNARVWSRVLTRLKQYLVKNASVIGEYPDDLKTRDNPRFTWSLVKPEPDKYFMLHDIYQRQGGSAQDEGVPAISYVDLLAGSDQPKGVHEILFWKSRIPPYFNYMCTCEIRDM